MRLLDVLLVLLLLLASRTLAAAEVVNTTQNNSIFINNSGNPAENISINNTVNNSILYDIALSPLLAEHVYIGIEYDSLFKLRNRRYKTKKSDTVNVTVAYNLTLAGNGTMNGSAAVVTGNFTVIVKSWKTAGTGMLTIDEEGNYTLCARIVAMNVTDENATNDETCQDLIVTDPFRETCNVTLALELKEPKLWYAEGETIRYWNRVERHDNGTDVPFIIRYWAEDLDGVPVRISTTENTNQKSWTPKVDGPFGVFLLKNAFDMIACDNVNGASGDTKLVVVQGGKETETPDNESRLEIQDVTIPNELGAGGTVKVTIGVYRGDTGKYSVKLSLRDVTGKTLATTRMHARQKYTDYKAMLPLVLTKAPGTGQYRIVLEGLDDRTSKSVWLVGKSMKKPVVNKTMSDDTVCFIQSFYTRNRKPSETINLYATIKGRGNETLDFISLRHHNSLPFSLNAENDTFKLKQQAAMQPGPNVFLLKVEDADGKILCREELLLEMDDEIRKVAYFTPGPSAATPSATTVVNDNPADGELEDGATGSLTGAVSYDVEQNTAALPVLLGTIGVLLLMLLLQHGTQPF